MTEKKEIQFAVMKRLKGKPQFLPVLGIVWFDSRSEARTHCNTRNATSRLYVYGYFPMKRGSRA